MSSVIEEVLTSSIGFIIAMVILTAVVAGGLYGYWVYANHVTLQNYLWPVAEVLPYQGEYFLAVVNTGHEPFTIKQIYLKGGGVLTPNQAANPNLNWCSVTNTELVHNQWWCGMVNQLPVAVMVCSALDPQVCSVVPVHGWQVVTFSQPTQVVFGVGNGSGSIEVVVDDPYNVGWKVTWSYPGLSTSQNPWNPWTSNTPSYSMSGSSSKVWYINPPYVPIQISFSASLTQSPKGYKCVIVPSSVTNTYSAGSVQEFIVDCNLEPITVSVSDSPGAGWLITWSGAASGSESGNSSTTFAIWPSSNNTVSFTASITSIPSSALSCSINPTSTTAIPGQKVTFTVSCRFPQYFVYVKVTGDKYGAGWSVCASAAHNLCISDWSDDTFTMPLSPLYAYIFYNPPGYTCTISPPGYNYVVNGSTYTFTVSCSGSPPPPPSNNYFVYVTVKNDSLGAGWTISSSVKSISGSGNVNNEQLPIGGQTDTLTATITSNPSGYACSISPSSEQVTSGNSYTFTVTCQGQGQQPPPPPPPPPSPPPSNYYCIVNPSASDNVNGASGAYVSPQGTQYIPPGQSVLFTWAIRNNPVPPDYYFNNWVITLNGQTVKTDQTSSTYYDFQCPSNLSSNQTYTLTGTAYYWERYLKAGGGNTFNVNGNGTYPVTSQYTTAYFTWSDPLFQSGSWSISYQQNGDSFTIGVQLNDAYSESATATPLTASTTLAIVGPPGYACYINSISPTSGSITSAQASNWLPTSAKVSITCVPQNGGIQ